MTMAMTNAVTIATARRKQMFVGGVGGGFVMKNKNIEWRNWNGKIIKRLDC
jgi:hypothetical protein